MSFEVDRPPDAGIGRSRPIRGDVDEPFRESMADLSRQLAARTVQSEPPIDPQGDVERAPEPVEPEQEVARRRSLLPVMVFALGVAFAAGLVAFLAKTPQSPQRPTVAAAATPPPQSSVVTVASPAPAIVDPPPVTAACILDRSMALRGR